jgi:hypothetical protein
VLYTTLSTAGTANHPQQFYIRIFLSTLVYHAWQRRYLLYQSSVYWVLLSKGTHPIK